MLKLFMIYLGLLSFPCLGFGDEKHDCNPTQSCLSVPELKAAVSALKQFEKDQPKADPKHFSIVVEEFPDRIDVEFVPDLVPIKEGSNGGTNYIEVPSGGGNQNGRDILYQISKVDGKVVKTLYAK